MTTEARFNKPLLYISAPAPCSYLPEHTSTMVFIDPDAQMNMSLYSRLVRNGFRRSGGFVYTPKCGQCEACIPMRLPAFSFQPNRAQKRIRHRGQHFTVHRRKPCFNEEHFRLYQHYLNSRHPGGGMDNPTPEQYLSFLTASWADSAFVEFRDNGRLVTVSVIDYLEDGLSAVYTFFDPDYDRFSPGKLAILWQLEETQRLEKDHLYLGYWVHQCSKMTYKSDFRPAEIFQNGHWRQLPREMLETE